MNYKKIGTFGNFNLIMKADLQYSEAGQEMYSNRLFVEGNLKYSYNNGVVARTAKLATQYPVNALNRIEGLVNTYENKNKEVQDKIDALNSLTLEFPKRDVLKEGEAKLKEISEKINKSIIQEVKINNTEEVNSSIRR